MENPTEFIPVFKQFLLEKHTDYVEQFYQTFDTDQCFFIVPFQVDILIELIEEYLKRNPPVKPTTLENTEYMSWYQIYNNLYGLKSALENDKQCLEAFQKYELIKDDEKQLLKWVLEFEDLGNTLVRFTHEIYSRTREYITEDKFENEVDYLVVSEYWNLYIHYDHVDNIVNFVHNHVQTWNGFAFKFLGDDFNPYGNIHHREYYNFDLKAYIEKNNIDLV